MIQQYEEKLLTLIDQMVETASDDELFAGGYLRGHISLSAANCELEGTSSIEVMDAKVVESMADAQSELNPADQLIVKAMWQQLQLQAR
ncbi:YfcL family protein [Photobacterium sp. DNB23_23_1]|uniref:YfcL family protein n=1 Tax=Photobacterium pectinilyticum TaxID=2906793 RepID=A0ABT1N846_9GAMM|nr:YfcL family protein [Photobacterium sp. ZSDE20]MCQ1060014.1 YfcL family protein [Photobacterium sp. ZSDE20]MDD1826963.1 YfcL family protein [Photobacterium sp. ZSDE20]